MDLLPLALVVAAAFLHAGWNFLAKESDDPLLGLWAALAAALILYAPAFVLRLPAATFTGGAWGFILATGLLHAMYFSALGMAYRTGELSIVYPLARGSAPLLASLFAALFLGERISGAGAAGIALVVAGVGASHLGGPGGWAAFLRRSGGGAGRWALVTGALTAVYSVVDKAGVARVSPEVYIYLMFALTWALILPYVLTGGRAGRLAALLRRQGGLRRAAAGGLCTMGAYGLVLFAMRMSKVSYVVAAREVSVIIGAALGVFVLKEGGRGRKLAGTALVAAGLVLLALSR